MDQRSFKVAVVNNLYRTVVISIIPHSQRKKRHRLHYSADRDSKNNCSSKASIHFTNTMVWFIIFRTAFPAPQRIFALVAAHSILLNNLVGLCMLHFTIIDSNWASFQSIHSFFVYMTHQKK
jgi:hypothetical protein